MGYIQYIVIHSSIAFIESSLFFGKPVNGSLETPATIDFEAVYVLYTGEWFFKEFTF